MDFAPCLPLVLIDKVQIQQVLLNLIRNAVEAMHDSRRRELTIKAMLSTDGLVEISVARQWSWPVRTGSGEAVPAIHHDKVLGHGRRPIDMPRHHRGTWRRDVVD